MIRLPDSLGLEGPIAQMMLVQRRRLVSLLESKSGSYKHNRRHIEAQEINQHIRCYVHNFLRWFNVGDPQGAFLLVSDGRVMDVNQYQKENYMTDEKTGESWFVGGSIFKDFGKWKW